MEFRVHRDCTALYLALQALPKCEEASLRPGGENDKELGESMLWLQNMLGNQTDTSQYGGSITIGRKPGSHVNLKDRAISSTHATVRWLVDVRPCPTTQFGDLSSAPLKAGDTINVSLSIMDSSTNGTYDGDVKCEKGKAFPLKAGVLCIPGTPNALQCLSPDISAGHYIYLGRPKSSDVGFPVFAFEAVICIAESLTGNVLNALSVEQLSAFPHEVQRHCFIGCVRDPRLARIKTEQFGLDHGSMSNNMTGIQSVAANAKTANVGVSIERQQAIRRDISSAGLGHQSGELEELRRQFAQLQQELAATMSEAEKTRVERERDMREANSKREEANMEIKLLEKKCQTYQQQVQTLQTENQDLRLTSQKMQESYELAECKRSQTQALLETSEQRCIKLEGERYKLSVATTQTETKNKTLETQARELERRLQDLDREHVRLTDLRRIETERLTSERDQYRAETEKLRQQIAQIKEQAQAMSEHDQNLKRKIRIAARFHKDFYNRQSKILDEILSLRQPNATQLINKLESEDSNAAATQQLPNNNRANFKAPAPAIAPSVTSNDWQSITSKEAAPAPPPNQGSEQISEEEHCSATDGEDTATLEGADESGTLGTDLDENASETPIQQNIMSSKENENPNHQGWVQEDMSKRRRKSNSMASDGYSEMNNAASLLEPDSQLS